MWLIAALLILLFAADLCLSRREGQERTYRARWTWAQCRAFLERRNVYDEISYRFAEDGTWIEFAADVRDPMALLRGRDAPRARYRIRGEDAEKGAVFTLRAQGGRKLPEWTLDGFSRRRVDAEPVKGEAWNTQG